MTLIAELQSLIDFVLQSIWCAMVWFPVYFVVLKIRQGLQAPQVRVRNTLMKASTVLWECSSELGEVGTTELRAHLSEGLDAIDTIRIKLDALESIWRRMRGTTSHRNPLQKSGGGPRKDLRVSKAVHSEPRI
jgi:hypothetical protein